MGERLGTPRWATETRQETVKVDKSTLKEGLYKVFPILCPMSFPTCSNNFPPETNSMAVIAILPTIEIAFYFLFQGLNE